MKGKTLFIAVLFVFLLSSCDMTRSNNIEGVWLSRGAELSVLYEETLTLSKDLSYVFEKKQDGLSVSKEKGTWELTQETVGDFEGNQRVISFTPTEPKGTTYKKMYALENKGMSLVLGTYDVESRQVLSQRFYKTGDVK